MAAITIERKAKSRRMKAKPSTKANTNGATDFISSLKSFDSAANPPTATSAPATAPTVSGTISPRSAARAALDGPSLPLPAIGMAMFATVRVAVDVDEDRLVHQAGGEGPLLELARSPPWTSAELTFGALTTTLAGISVPGNAACSRL